jgi:putative peptidoglycan lipid II flippase
MKKINSIAAAAALMAFAVLVSRILGYVREMILAYYYGAGNTADAFYAAFQIPDLLNYFLAGGALSIAFIPLYHRALARGGPDVAQNLFNIVLGTMGAAVTVVTLVLMQQTPVLIPRIFPGFDAATAMLASDLTRIVLPAQIFFIVGGIMQAVLLAERHFLAAALSPLIYNVCIIIAGLTLHNSMGIEGFAWGTLAGSILGPFLMPLIFGRKVLRFRPRIAPLDRTFASYLIVAAPLMFGQTLLTVDEWLGRFLGASMDPGTVAHIAYARRLIQVPVAVIGQAIAAAALPTLSKMWAEGKTQELNETLTRTLGIGVLLSILAAGAMIGLSQPLVETIYERGAFTARDSAIVAGLVSILSFAIPAWIIQQILLRAFYAREQTLRVMVLCTVITLASIPLYFYGAERLAATGFAMASAIAMTASAVVMIVYARFLHHAPEFSRLWPLIWRGLAACVPAALAANKHYAAWPTDALGIDLWPRQVVALCNLAYGGLVFAVVGYFILTILFAHPLWFTGRMRRAKK